MNIQKIKNLVQQLKEIDTYQVDTDSEGFLYVERNVNGHWISAYSVECIVDELEKELGEV